MKLAVLGLNHGFVFASEIKKMKGVTLVAVAGQGPLAERSAQMLDVPLYGDYEQLIEERQLDGAIIALPNQLHKKAAFLCANKGIGVLIEKPIADTVADGEDITRFFHSHGVPLMVGHHRRFSKKINHLKSLLSEGVIGELISVHMVWALAKDKPYFAQEWRVNNGGGPLLINGIHDIDNLRYVTDLEIESAYAVARHTIRGQKVEDSLTAILEAAGGVVIHYFLSDGVPSPWAYEMTMNENDKYPCYKEDCYHFYGEKGSLAFPSFRCYTYNEEQYGWEHRLIEKNYSPTDNNDPIKEELYHFIDVLAGKDQPAVPGEEGTRTLAVLEAIRKSVREKSRITVRGGLNK
ncbi:NADH-dependent dehydrogenase [Niallia circulans]|uniref:Gfo/Idh/MocA family protein n=1 Tax=Shouchella clausii TaxID=79880 RepID=UPI000BA65F2E|nr:Gfo/Idh/MocA family oxidoreductase [Shouchella clausii]SPU17706.1 NADH-dependent dehydrogenase [Niallia circulans]MBU8595878.1 Gfo/Idh/MocA family oxidoreductase [Shouchella clausii]MCM3548375.1 Gfo/Idh/MocA family oxidoreductase [Shouchella clausii]MCY1103058.1 Gfo/Idh/MocA family oxidoreductase [Shouchella clausii]MEB5478040.1 Gfo/Idh/MocA family oxidoreductase [Shouchella clausii]